MPLPSPKTSQSSPPLEQQAGFLGIHVLWDYPLLKKIPLPSMNSFILTTCFILFALFWVALGLYLLINYQKIFGQHPDDPAESPGARSFGVCHIVAVWIGGMVLAIGALIYRF